MDTSKDVAIGDWVAFYVGGVLHYSPVRYIRTDFIGKRYICTEHGETSMESIREVRKP